MEVVQRAKSHRHFSLVIKVEPGIAFSNALETWRTVPTSDFSGLTSWAWALASAAAIVPIVSLERSSTRTAAAPECGYESGTRRRVEQ
jgi:hypothetical protein